MPPALDIFGRTPRPCALTIGSCLKSATVVRRILGGAAGGGADALEEAPPVVETPPKAFMRDCAGAMVDADNLTADLALEKALERTLILVVRCVMLI